MNNMSARLRDHTARMGLPGRPEVARQVVGGWTLSQHRGGPEEEARVSPPPRINAVVSLKEKWPVRSGV